ncbi:MAG: hypothetical protein GX951_04365 [Mollicutes bacterium]|nr:hypothetical protein [Mollicutes bacterium]
MKKIWKNNRVLLVLIIILIICFVAIIGVALTFFYSKEVSVYGDRLKNIEKNKIAKADIKKYKETVSSSEHVTRVTWKTRGRLVYINITFDKDITLEDAKKLVTDSLTAISEKITNYYDFEFILGSDNFNIIGGKNITIDYISWNNNTEVIKEDETNEKP